MPYGSTESRCKIGIAKAIVFPEPVFALPIQSLPCQTLSVKDGALSKENTCH